MRTDWVLIARLAQELEARLGGSRIEEAGLLSDGRPAIVLRKGGHRTVLAADLFASPPLITLEDCELGVAQEQAFIRTLSRALKGMVLGGVSARRFDRLIRLRFASRSRFGVGERLDVILELVPRFGNMVLVKGETVVAALKEFGPRDNPGRPIEVGSPYRYPPLSASPVTLGDPPVAEPAAPDQPLHVYRRDGELLQAYATPLAGFAAAEHSLVPSLLEVFTDLRGRQTARANSERSSRGRTAMLRRLEQRERRLRGEIEGLAAKRQLAFGRADLRRDGEAIFATLHLLPDAQREESKDRATALFARYKKLGKSLPHIAARDAAVRAALEVVETLRWEAERAGAEQLDEVQAAVLALLEPCHRSSRPPPRRRKRRLMEFRTAHGSRILVGRSPIENAELTFSVARPNDLWFHARGTPGAHVILTRDQRDAIPDEDLWIAASLAAYYSKAQTAAAAPVDYTLRKHVRKQRDAPPGLVWYTHAKTLVAQPRAPDAAKDNLVANAQVP